MIDELHKGGYVIYRIEHKAAKDDPVVLRKIRKEGVSLRKLVTVSTNHTNPILHWNDGDKEIISVVSVEGLSKSSKVAIEYSHNNTRTFLSLKTFVFKDLITNIEHEIDYNQIAKIIVPSSCFTEIDKAMEAETILF